MTAISTFLGVDWPRDGICVIPLWYLVTRGMGRLNHHACELKIAIALKGPNQEFPHLFFFCVDSNNFLPSLLVRGLKSGRRKRHKQIRGDAASS